MHTHTSFHSKTNSQQFIQWNTLYRYFLIIYVSQQFVERYYWSESKDPYIYLLTVFPLLVFHLIIWCSFYVSQTTEVNSRTRPLEIIQFSRTAKCTIFSTFSFCSLFICWVYIDILKTYSSITLRDLRIHVHTCMCAFY